MGLINHAVPRQALDAQTDHFVTRMSEGPLKAIKYTKAATNIGLRQLAHSIMDASVAYELATTRTADHLEALAAFKDKRKPKFQGR